MVVGALVIGIGLGAVALSLVGDDGPDHPDTWDPRLADLVAFVEAEKGEPFEHPVEVEFLDEAAFDAELTVDEAELTDEDRSALDDSVGMLRALGVASGDVSLVEAFNKLDTGGTLAYYDAEEDRIVIEGTELDVPRAVTVVHELTHAWQDQHADLGRDIEDPAADEAFRAIVEGDASRVESAYVDDLDPDERSSYEDTTDEQLEDFDTEGVPTLLVADQSAPYAIGLPFLDVLAADGGEDAIAAVFDRPPRTTEQLIDPIAYLDDDEPDEVPTPAVPGGGEALDESSFGALSLYLLLADRLEPLEALAVADAWQGDAYVLGRADGRACVAISVRLELTVAQPDEPTPAESLQAWADQLPDASAEVDGQEVSVQACDPGPEAEVDVVGRSEEVLGYPVTRLHLLAAFAEDGMDLDDPTDVELGRCLIDGFLGGISPEEMLADDVDESRGAQLMEDAAAACSP